MILEEHEVFCPKCKGTGKERAWMTGDFIVTPECHHCYGSGILDWVERITGKPPRQYDEHYAEAIKMASENLRDQIDKDILAEIYQEGWSLPEEQNIKEKGG